MSIGKLCEKGEVYTFRQKKMFGETLAFKM